MNTTFEKYLDTVDKCLKPLPTSERVDIVKEIKGSILEMESDHLSTEEILNRLGNPKDLAKAYLGDLLSKESGFSWNRFLVVCAFYSVVGFSGMIAIPCLAIMAPVFIINGIACPIIMAVKLADSILHLGLPYMENIGVFTGIIELNPIAEFVITLVIGTLLFLVGRGCWKLLIYYCKRVSKAKSDLEI